MPVPDARTRSKITLNPKVFSSSIPTKVLPQILLSNALLVSAIHGGKSWLLDLNVGIFWVIMRVFACGGLGVLIWEVVTGRVGKRKDIEFSVLAMASVLLFVQQACLFTALFRLSSIRVILLTHFSAFRIEDMLNTVSAAKGLAVGLAFTVSYLSDIQFSSANAWHFIPPYGALILHALASVALEHTYSVMTPSLGSTFSISASTLGAACFALPLYLFRTILLGFPNTPVLPLGSLAILPFIAWALLFRVPLGLRSLSHLPSPVQQFTVSYPASFFFTVVIGFLAFSQNPSWTDILVASLMYIGLYPPHQDGLTRPPGAPISRLIRSYIKTILSNQESRKIFYFLMLNMCYMLVQMLYGVWTNSLGLISDAIHMAFDCMAIGVGLMASVMATWEPNERFTYGYGRIETLSGFANGIFLILISIFIVFEAIQRLLDPPEMNTSQLLLVSTLGLAVNLFGMFAMGGHHHGGHSHSHTHSHSHDDLHTDAHNSHRVPSPAQHNPELHSHDHCDTHSHLHSHSHSNEGFHTVSTSHSQRTDPLPAPDSALGRPRLRPPPFHLVHDNFVGPNDAVPSPMSSGSTASQQYPSPITPSYQFGHDNHYSTHSQHVPNLHDHSHVHDHSHEGHSHNMRGVFLHVMADTLGSVGVIISTLLIKFYGWTGFDPIASLFIAVLIAASVVPLVMDTGRILCLDVSDRNTSIQQALSELSSIEGLASYSSPRFWPKDASSLIGSIHIHLSSSASSVDISGPHSTLKTTYTNMDRVVERVDALLKQRIAGLEELTIQVAAAGSS